MNKKLTAYLGIGLGAVVIAGAVLSAFTLCQKDNEPPSGGGSKKYNPETQTVVFAVGALDKNFNPFFATSANDTEVIGMTQVGLVTSDKDGKAVAGADQPTVALDFSITEHKLTNGTTEYTDYEFLLKNGVKFSDGSALTIDDVLFNLYVYLDPVYTGSTTIYSTDIQGLNAYRAQDSSVGDDYSGSVDETFYNTAQGIIEDLADYANGDLDDEPVNYVTHETRIHELFKEELSSIWTANYGTLKSYETEYSFTHDWQTFYLLTGLVMLQDPELHGDGTVTYPKDQNDKYLTNINNADGSINQDNIYVEEMNDATTADKISAYAAANNCTQEEAKENLIKEAAIETVFQMYEGDLYSILYGFETGMTYLEELAAKEKSDYYLGKTGVSSVSGITTAKVNEFKGQSGELKQLAAEHDVLKIRINGVDPKAIWNFAFGVAPKSYYSGTYNGVNYATDSEFGVKTNDFDFFNTVLKGTEKSGLPMGAGVYMATNANDSGTVDRYNFCNNGVVYYKRNPYFYTLGVDSYTATLDYVQNAQNDTNRPIHNAIIKYFNYQEVAEDKILSLLADGTIHYGEPSASADNYKALQNDTDSLNYRDYLAGGYGYVGINPKFVPELELRQAIMKAMDVSLMIDEYYAGGLASTIYRPMSKTSWAYPKDATEYPSIKYTTNDAEIKALVEAAGYTYDSSDGKYKKDGKKITLKFTIAGGSTDHPATVMFEAAARRLNQIGFDITVGTDVNALKNLATGNLAVWAAAWSSAIDPDMYQIYHKNSTATSVLNWNYKEILYTDKYEREKKIVNSLSDLIDQARKTTNEKERISKYSQALDKVMELAVELPTYQRNELAVYNEDLIDASSLNDDPSWTAGVVNEIWKLSLN